jgi:hypothetical protein
MRSLTPLHDARIAFALDRARAHWSIGSSPNGAGKGHKKAEATTASADTPLFDLPPFKKAGQGGNDYVSMIEAGLPHVTHTALHEVAFVIQIV